MTMFAVVLAAVAAFGYAFGARLQHGAVHDTISGRRLGVRNQLRLVRNTRWLLGLICLASGTVLHALALGLAPLSVVQPLGVLALPITVLLNSGGNAGELGKLPRSTIVAVLMSGGGVAAFVFLAMRSATPTSVTSEAAVTAIQLVTVTVLVCGVVALLSRSSVRCVAYASGCAVAYGLVSLLLRAVSQQVTSGRLAEVELWLLLAMVVAVLIGGWLLQHAYASGPPDLAVACLTVIDPLVAVGLGIGLLGEADAVGTSTAMAEVVCAAIACAGVFALARYHPDNRSDVAPTVTEDGDRRVTSIDSS
ncbi:multidrug resistance efflux transporter family protein [Actinopolyspora saharensis]|uniref:Putative multidrug resistance efflux transporter n=1 Tax=Actinopolyspora saharensis TaxID=995062 RepID=A0A1H1EQB7_9ACTN|nr:multidrug resistance efflux transporter family protein [Actinopolyspora saharensis]SDQ90933.1 Putative multidrug resistance efflux transporter [Actinopolyspora saharensis]